VCEAKLRGAQPGVEEANVILDYPERCLVFLQGISSSHLAATNLAILFGQREKHLEINFYS
jgi:hypothetical protein